MTVTTPAMLAAGAALLGGDESLAAAVYQAMTDASVIRVDAPSLAGRAPVVVQTVTVVEPVIGTDGSALTEPEILRAVGRDRGAPNVSQV